ncbi:MAG TPA: hypothetical protein VND89_05525 [Acidimicrobiales bacterium]|nr:hypothetical protein [Acidimicrobiales bacterium]
MTDVGIKSELERERASTRSLYEIVAAVVVVAMKQILTLGYHVTLHDVPR